MRFGAHVNAQTSFDETTYELQIPTRDPAVIDRALLILEDWAHQVSFDPDEVEKERGVIMSGRGCPSAGATRPGSGSMPTGWRSSTGSSVSC